MMFSPASGHKAILTFSDHRSNIFKMHIWFLLSISMSDFDTLCKELEQMDPETFTNLFNELSVDVIKELVALTADGTDGLTAYMQFLLASVAADGTLSEAEFDLLKPFFDKMADKDLTYEQGAQIFRDLGLDNSASYRKVVDTMVDIIGLVDDSLKDKIVMICLLVCAIDGEVTKEEKDWIRQLLEPLDIKIDVMSYIDKFLSDAKVFTLATTCGDQPRMRVLGLKVKLDGKLYFAVGTFKDVYKQLQANPKCEILASVGTDFLRWDGIATFCDDPRLMQITENMMPDLCNMYAKMGWKLGFFTLENGSAEIVNVNNEKKRIL